jgi:transcriptional regulator with XRE-family HTH domain
MHDLPTPHELEVAAKAAGFTMTQVCERAGIAFSTWARWKSGESSISVKRCQDMLTALSREAAQ